MSVVRIGSGAGYAGDRIEPAVELAEHGRLDYLVFECLAERTIALAQAARLTRPDTGFDPLLRARMTTVLPACAANGVRVITNMGAANPRAAAQATLEIARTLGLKGLRIATILGDDVLDFVHAEAPIVQETGEPATMLGERLVSANAYLGIEPILDALAMAPDVILAGRLADPSMFLAPMVQTFGWALDDWPGLGAGTVVGHLLECAGQVTGGYFADPGYKDVAGLARLGFPLAEVDADGTAVITKVSGSGGLVTRATCKEQLLYELHDPTGYITPDVVADFSGVTLTDDGNDRVRVAGASGTPRPPMLKVALGVREGYIGEGQISYGGAGAVARARLAGAIVTERLRLTGAAFDDLRIDLIGLDAIHGPRLAALHGTPYEVRLRVAGRTSSSADAARVGNEVEALYTNGPAAGGGATKSVREVLAVATTFMPRQRVTVTIDIVEV